MQVSDFRKNMAMFLGKLDEGYEIDLKRGKEYEAKLIAHPKKKRIANNIDVFLRDIEKLRKKYPFRGGKNLSMDIDKILYGK